jgi:hypothetical protein
MKDINQLRAEHAAQLAKLEREIAIASAMPIAPDSVMVTGFGEPWITYKRVKLSEALEVFRAFRIAPCSLWRGTFTTIKPEALLTDRERESYREDFGPCAAWIEVHQGEGFGPSAELEFFAETSVGIVRVKVSFGSGYIETAPQLSARFEEIKGGRNGRETVELRALPNPECRAIADHFVKWSVGGFGERLKRAARFSYMLCANESEALNGADQSHALSMLEILADRAKV